MSAASKWESVIGLEIHARLATRSKLFSAAATEYGAPPNSQACAVDLGMPGVLPVINGKAVEMAVVFGLAVNGDIARRSVFARKNYFYPDLPKGYQISQYELPIVSGGEVFIRIGEGKSKRIALARAHLEEDAGKSEHEDFGDYTGIDLNRAGIPLLEIVSEPVLRSAAEAAACMKAIHGLVRYLGICDGNMQEGSLRCDANVSVREAGARKLGTRAEIKNLNSFRFVEQALDYEIRRQMERKENGEEIMQETRLYDPEREETRPMRGKEDAQDYRYFPDPDLLPVVLEEAWIERVKSSLPELPERRRQRFMSEFRLSERDSDMLAADKDTADYFERAAANTRAPAKLAANWIMGELTALLHRDGLDIAASKVSGEELAALLDRIADDTLSGNTARQALETMWRDGGEVDAIIERQGLRQLTDSAAIEKLVDEAIAANADQVRQYREAAADKRGKLIGYFVGQVMKKSAGKAEPKLVNKLLREKLDA